MKAFYLIASLLISCVSYAKQVRVAVIDTGLTNSYGLPLCDGGHKSVIGGNLKDTLGHGTNVAHLIHRHAAGADYCMIIVKFFPTKNAIKSTIAALQHVKKLDVDIVNYSAGGNGANFTEQELLRSIILSGTIVVTAAGNDGKDLDKKCHYFPACYFQDHVIVGNGHGPNSRARTSNYGSPIDVWVNGQNQTAGGYTMSGTSQSSAIVTGRIIHRMSAKRNTSSDSRRAAEKLAQAAYKHTKLDKKVDKQLKKLEKMLPKKVKEFGGVLLPLTHGIIRQRIQYEWEF